MNYKYNLDDAYERFVGWIPRAKASRGILFFYIIYYLACFFICPYMPGFLIFGWISSTIFWNWLFTAVGLLVGGIYFNKYWPALKDKDMD